MNEYRVVILYLFVALGIFYYISESGKELYNAENVKTKQAGVGVVYQPQDQQKELQRSVSQVPATMQAELSRDCGFLSKIRPELGPEKRPGFTRK